MPFVDSCLTQQHAAPDNSAGLLQLDNQVGVLENGLVETSGEDKFAQSTIGRLNDDILERIVEFRVAQSEGDWPGPERLTATIGLGHVCRHLRLLLLSRSFFWSNLWICPQSDPARIAFALEHSRDSPLIVHMQFGEYNVPVVNPFAMILPHASRVAELSIEGPDSKYLERMAIQWRDATMLPKVNFVAMIMPDIMMELIGPHTKAAKFIRVTLTEKESITTLTDVICSALHLETLLIDGIDLMYGKLVLSDNPEDHGGDDRAMSSRASSLKHLEVSALTNYTAQILPWLIRACIPEHIRRTLQFVRIGAGVASTPFVHGLVSLFSMRELGPPERVYLRGQAHRHTFSFSGGHTRELFLSLEDLLKKASDEVREDIRDALRTAANIVVSAPSAAAVRQQLNVHSWEGATWFGIQELRLEFGAHLLSRKSLSVALVAPVTLPALKRLIFVVELLGPVNKQKDPSLPDMRLSVAAAHCVELMRSFVLPGSVVIDVIPSRLTHVIRRLLQGD
ncbi:hypothetical protein BKA62DRAFT_713065 [Auriculariales sp. MPI-PUGE-AT-0066]|nr:hypothetical protein BKA62DRAFT_713065 [Auriculariales sp. MPI-PUGE-AT-0066]